MTVTNCIYVEVGFHSNLVPLRCFDETGSISKLRRFTCQIRREILVFDISKLHTVRLYITNHI